MSDQTPVSIVGARLAERWVCDGCGKAMRYEAIRTHIKWCAQNPTSRRCPTCVHMNRTFPNAGRCAVDANPNAESLPWHDPPYDPKVPYSDPGCTKWVEL